MIIFKKIRYKNFLSTGNQPIEIDLSKKISTISMYTDEQVKIKLKK